MTCIDLPPAAEIRCLDAMNMAVNREITKLRAAKRPCPEVPEDAVADCDCYAERKAAILRGMGYSARLRIVYVIDVNEWHRVTEASGRVFDNRYARTEAPKSLRTYVWMPPEAVMPR